MTSTVTHGTSMGSLARVEGVDKVTGRAKYAFEYDVDQPAYAWPVVSDIAHGRVTHVDTDAGLAEPGVLAVLWHANAPRLHEPDAMLAVLQRPEVAYRGQVVALVIAMSQEEAREAAARLPVRYDVLPHDTV